MSRIIKYRKFNSTRKFGVELEINNTIPKYRLKQVIKSVSPVPIKSSGWNTSDNNDYWHIKEDSSCGPLGLDGPRGFEIASYVGQGIGDIQHIAYVADTLQKKKVEVTHYCGLHIHADGSDLTVEQVGTIVAYWLKIEYVLGMILPPRRHDNDFCRHMLKRCRWLVDRQKQYNAAEFWELMKPQELTTFDNEDRRVTLNLVNYARGVWYKRWCERKTLELRWPEGTLVGRDVKNWLRLFLHFIDNVKDRAMPDNTESCCLEDALTILGLHHEGCIDDPPHQFYILSEGLMDTKTWFLERLIVYSSWTQQKYIREAKEILAHMWNPLRKYGSDK